MSSDSIKSYEVLNDFKLHHDLLKDKTNFTPHYVLSYYPPGGVNENCYSEGKYCAPDLYGSGALQGRNILKEDLNQLCIFKKDPESFWKYIEIL